MNFKKLTIEQLKIYKDILPKSESNSESSLANMFIWQHYYDSVFCMDDEVLYGIYVNPETKMKEAFMPYGCKSCSEEAVDKIIGYLRNNNSNKKVFIGFATESFLDFLLKTPKYHITYCEMPNSFDYVYNVSELIELKGKKYHSKKNHYNSFVKKHDFKYIKYDSSWYDKCLDFCKKTIERQSLGNEKIHESEFKSIKKAFDNFDDLELVGSMLTLDDEIIALSVGEHLNSDMALIHIEKASYDYRTAYSVINRLMLKNEFSDFRFVNREEDMGIEGIRKAKESYHPCKYIKKFRIEIE